MRVFLDANVLFTAARNSSIPLLAALMRRGTPVGVDRSAPFPDGLPATDAVIFQAVVTCRATHFLTGDLRHFGPFMNRPVESSSIIIQTVADFLASV
jgi:hypothetical protein